MTKKDTIIIGDLHLDVSQKIWITVGNNIIKYIDTLSDKYKRAILLGDLVHIASATGTLNSMLEDLRNILTKFEEVIVIAGNHDFFNYGKDNEVLYKFFERSENIKIITEPYFDEVRKELFLPYTLGNTSSPAVFYKEYLKQFEGKDINNIYGHITAYDEKNPDWLKRNAVDFSSLNYRNLILGHIHSQIAPYYTGSIAPHASSEYKKDNSNRCLFELDKDNTLTVLTLPHFLTYEEVIFPNEFKKENNGIPCFLKVQEVNDFKSAQKLYEKEDIYIYEYHTKQESNGTVIRENISKLSLVDLYAKAKEEKAFPISKDEDVLMQALLET